MKSHITFLPPYSNSQANHKPCPDARKGDRLYLQCKSGKFPLRALRMRDAFSAIFETYNLPQSSLDTALHIPPT